MPSAIITLPDGRRARLEGPSREAIMQQAQRISNPGIDPNTGQFDRDLADIDRLMTGTGRGRTIEEFRDESGLPVTLPFGLGDFKAKGMAADAVRAASSVDKETAVPVVNATMGSVALPLRAASAAPAGIGLLRRAATAPFRAASRVVPPTAGAGAGGALAGAGLEAQREGSTPESIAREAATTGAQMAGAELLGHGVAGAAGRVIAPRLSFLDPASQARKAFNSWMSELPSAMREGARRVEEAFPTGAARDATRAVGGALEGTAETLARLVKSETADRFPVSAGQIKETSEKVASRLGDAAASFGFGTQAPRVALANLVRSGERNAIRVVRNLSRKDREVALETVFNSLRESATRNGAFDGQAFMAAWREMPANARGLFSRESQRAVESLAGLTSAVARVGRFARNPVGGEILEMMVTPALAATAGPGVAIPFMLGKALINPGPTARWLASGKLPPGWVRATGRQAVTTGARGMLGEADE